jgi:membrane fusion protein (multidrug efflux system)
MAFFQPNKKLILSVFISIAIGILGFFIVVKFLPNQQQSSIPVKKLDKKADKTIVSSTPVTYININTQSLNVYKKSVGQVYNLNTVKLASEVSGQILDVYVDVGDRVKVGQIIAKIDPREIQNSKNMQEANIKQLRTNLSDAQRTLGRIKELKKEDFASQAELDSAETQVASLKQQIASAIASLENYKVSLEKTSIISPITGVIQDRVIAKGNYVRPADDMFSIVDNRKLTVILNYPDYEADYFKKGQKVILNVDGINSKIISSIKEVKPLIDPNSLSIHVIVDIDGSKYNIKPGAVVTAEVLVEEKLNAIVVPKTSVVLRSSGYVVFVLNQEKNKVLEKKVKVGIKERDRYEIIEGLSAGENIIVEGAGFLTNDASVNIQQGIK